MMKTINITVDFEDTRDGERDRDAFAHSVRSSARARTRRKTTIETHDCYHDEDKPCQKREVVFDDVRNE